MVKNDLKKFIEKFPDYKLLAENEELQFTRINSVTEEVEKYWQFYEIDHKRKRIFLELKQSNKYILITTSDSLELPIATVKNINEAAKVLDVEATHIYRAYRRAGRPKCLAYNKFLLFFDHF